MKKWIVGIFALCFGLASAYALYAYHSEPIYYVLVGPPGSGKGTLASRLAEDSDLPVITTSQVLRQAMKEDTPVALEVKSLMDSGQFVPDEIINKVLADELRKPMYSGGAIFDGFPRTLGQTIFFKENNIQIALMIILDVSDDVIIQRMEGRRVHKPSGRMYHIEYMPPKVPGKDDITGEDLERRPDDRADVVKERLDDYYRLTAPIVDWGQDELQRYNGIVSAMILIDASQDAESVWNELSRKVS